MGRKDYELRADDPIISLLVFKLAEKVRFGYRTRLEKDAKERGVDLAKDKEKSVADTLKYLAPHFMNFEVRAQEVAKKEIERERKQIDRRAFWGTIITAIVPVTILIIGIFYNFGIFKNISKLEGRIDVLEGYIAILENKDKLGKSVLLDTVRTEKRLCELEQELEAVKDSIKREAGEGSSGEIFRVNE